jgi:hypothetical protein
MSTQSPAKDRRSILMEQEKENERKRLRVDQEARNERKRILQEERMMKLIREQNQGADPRV